MRNTEEVNDILAAFHDCVVSGKPSADYDGHTENLKVGVDLGTSSIVLAVVDQKGRPVYGALEYAHAVRDGLVVDYVGAVAITRRLKAQAEEALGGPLTTAAGAIPPGTIGNNKAVVGHVLEAADFTVTDIFDEPTAASLLLGITSGAVVDIGGGTTGISVIKKGKVSYTVDEATGGSHMTLVVGGHYGIPVEEAEALKRDKQKEDDIFAVVKPVIEKMATISAEALRAGRYRKGMPVHIVGGAVNFRESESVFEKVLGREIIKPVYPEFVTPLGIALGSE